MSQAAREGVEFAQSNEIRVGTELRPDGGFDCLKEGSTAKVFRDPDKKGFAAFYIKCNCDHGRHYLIGQLGDHNELVGLYRTGTRPSVAA